MYQGKPNEMSQGGAIFLDSLITANHRVLLATFAYARACVERCALVVSISMVVIDLIVQYSNCCSYHECEETPI